LSEPIGDQTITAAQLGIRDLPKGWTGASLAQLVASAREIVKQSEATDGSADPRLEAALRVLEFKSRSEGRKK
jgi:hypothetical protein